MKGRLLLKRYLYKETFSPALENKIFVQIVTDDPHSNTFTSEQVLQKQIIILLFSQGVHVTCEYSLIALFKISRGMERW